MRARLLGLTAVALAGTVALPLRAADRGSVSTRPPLPPIVFAGDRLPVLYGDVVEVNLDGRQTALATRSGNNISPAVSPDGRYVAFASDRGSQAAAYVMDITGRHVRRVAGPLFRLGPGSGLVASVGWSPTGRTVTAAVSGDGVHSVFLIATITGTAHVLSQRGYVAQWSWSTDGRRLAFVQRVGGSTVLRVVDTNGAPLWRSSIGDVDNPSWSADGRLAVRATGNRIHVYERDGGEPRSLSGRSFAWSPDGADLAVIRGSWLELHRGAHETVSRRIKILFEPNEQSPYLMPLTWNDPRHVTITTANGRARIIDVTTGAVRIQPKSAPWDAKSASGLAARTVSTQTTDRLVLVRARAGRVLVSLPHCPYGNPFGWLQFTPDSAALVYQSACREPTADLFAMDPSGGRVRQVTSTPAHEFDPRWSPDGSNLLYLSTPATGLECKGCPSTIWVARADGTGRRRINRPRNGAFDISPSWSPDGREVVYAHSTLNTESSLYVVSARGGRARPIGINADSPEWGPESSRLPPRRQARPLDERPGRQRRPTRCTWITPGVRLVARRATRCRLPAPRRRLDQTRRRVRPGLHRPDQARPTHLVAKRETAAREPREPLNRTDRAVRRRRRRLEPSPTHDRSRRTLRRDLAPVALRESASRRRTSRSGTAPAIATR